MSEFRRWSRISRSRTAKSAQHAVAAWTARPVVRAKLTPVYDLSRLAPCPAVLATDLAVEPASADDGLPPTRFTYVEDRATAEPFGAWLVKQKGRGGLLDQLATAAAGDRGLTKATTPQDLRRRLVEQQADGDMHDALDDAEIDWLAL